MPIQLNYTVKFNKGPMKGLSLPQKVLASNQILANQFIKQLERQVASGRTNFTFTVDGRGQSTLQKYRGLDVRTMHQAGPQRVREMTDNEDQPDRMHPEREHDTINAVAVHTNPEQDQKKMVNWSFIDHDEEPLEIADYDDEWEDLDDILDGSEDFEFNDHNLKKEEGWEAISVESLNEYAHQFDLAEALHAAVQKDIDIHLHFTMEPGHPDQNFTIDPMTARQILEKFSDHEINSAANHQGGDNHYYICHLIGRAIGTVPMGFKNKYESLVNDVICNNPAKFGERFQKVLNEAAYKVISRVRGGKIQRRVKIAAMPGYTIRSGKLHRISPAEHRRRVMSNRRGAIKRRAKLRQSLRKRAISMRRRKMAFGRR